MKKQIAQIKKKQEQLAILLDEYQKIVENENKRYHLLSDQEVNRKENWTDTFKCQCGATGHRFLYNIPDHKYILVDRTSKEVICYGTKQRLKSFMRLRAITIENVFVDNVEDMKW